ncbi:type II RES/Xre toxin-antitoxin system antitoxin [Patiriisocius marinistellae]|nr:antitoxin Xre/MbcA/ParS toxin-binding domain-containing protein [Patiriisocius marinistellae]
MKDKPIKNIMSEPETYYSINSKYDRLIGVLGGSRAVGYDIQNDIDLIALTRRGLPKSVLASVCFVLGVSMEKMSGLLHISHRTLQRKKDDEFLNAYSTEQILEIAQLISHGIQVFGTIERFKKWVHQDVRALSYKMPIDYLDTTFGIKMVRDVMGRIEHGVYS